MPKSNNDKLILFQLFLSNKALKEQRACESFNVELKQCNLMFNAFSYYNIRFCTAKRVAIHCIAERIRSRSLTIDQTKVCGVVPIYVEVWGSEPALQPCRRGGRFLCNSTVATYSTCKKNGDFSPVNLSQTCNQFS